MTDKFFPIVGIAASAGGLEAFTQLLKHLSSDTGMTFVLIQHLAPNHKSLLTEILARTTSMPVSEVQDGVTVEPNHVYIIPPNTKMILAQGRLQLAPREKVEGKYMPGDAFFTSLAAERGAKAIAVVLSGTDGDGSLGLTEIKAAGGVTFAQCEGTAKFDSMPNTAVASGNVDFILPPEKIAEELTTISRHPFIAHPPSASPVEKSPESEDALPIVFALLRSATGVDFSHYKPTTIARRMQRRMLLYKLECVADYADYLQANPAEVKALYEEILIHVTSFFRDPEVFQQLKAQVFPTITQIKSAESPIRIWVVGCSTGEEVYSIAIGLLEFLADRATRLPIQIFATDISEPAIHKARAGIYQENQMVDVSPERRRSFFVPLEHGGYQISKAVRELCVFARQDVGSDPPFSTLDLISCRNVLIYLSEALQKRVMPIFHFSLNPTGFLLLGPSESTGQFSDLFTVVDRQSKIYAKKLTTTRPTFSFTPSSYPTVKVRARQPMQAPPEGFDLQKKADQLIANHYAPVGVVIDDQMQVLQLRGDIDRYLKLVSGVVNLNLFNLVRAGLSVELRAAIYQAQRQEMPVRKDRLCLEEGNHSGAVNLQVIPFKVPPTEERRFLVLFEEAPPMVSRLSPVDPESPQADLARENARLRQELAAATQERAATQEYLQAVIQDQEHGNQDLNVANEEILSSNEELQSTNEELETAKEEIQATNEELNTTNEELRSRNQELHRINNDLTNLLASINIPILMLTNDLRIRRFTPMAQRLFNFIPADAGRPLSDIRTNLTIPDLEPLLLEVLETLSVKELDVQTQGGHWYTLRIRPYRTTENQIDGVVLVLLDIDALKRSAVMLEAARSYTEAIVETVQVPLIVLESDLRVNTANRSFYETFRVSPPETEQSLIFDLGNGQWNISGLRSLLEDVSANDTTFQNFEVEHDFEQIGQKTMLLNALMLIQAGDTQRILLAIEDITERKQFEAERSHLLSQEQSARRQAEAANSMKDEFLSVLSHEVRTPLNAILGWASLLRTRTFDPATTARALETIERNARAQTQLVDDLLNVSRIIRGKLVLDIRPVELVSVIEAAMETVRPTAEAKSIQLIAMLDDSASLVSADYNRLQQVVSNLLSNAVKFTPDGGRVEVFLERFDSYTQIRVSDTGMGIAPEFLPYIFERFRQADSTPTRSNGGLGLGLAIVHHLVELHGGAVRAESSGEGQGTTMIVTLPLRSVPPKVAPPSDLEAAQEQPLEVVSREVPSLEGLHILVVDDDVDSLALIKHMLEDAGAEVVVVALVREAISILTASPDRYDVLLADIGMPDEDGFSLIRKVRALGAEAGRQIPAVAITAYVSDQDRQMAIDAGFQIHLAKPVDLVQLVFAIVNLTR